MVTCPVRYTTFVVLSFLQGATVVMQQLSNMTSQTQIHGVRGITLLFYNICNNNNNRQKKKKNKIKPKQLNHIQTLPPPQTMTGGLVKAHEGNLRAMAAGTETSRQCVCVGKAAEAHSAQMI